MNYELLVNNVRNCPIRSHSILLLTAFIYIHNLVYIIYTYISIYIYTSVKGLKYHFLEDASTRSTNRSTKHIYVT
jgi:hypothetical protein